MNSSRRDQTPSPQAKNHNDPAAESPPENSAGTSGLRSQPLHEEITKAAKHLWQHYGSPDGRDEEIWLEAERQVLGTDPDVATVEGGSVSAQDLREAGAGALTQKPDGRKGALERGRPSGDRGK